MWAGRTKEAEAAVGVGRRPRGSSCAAASVASSSIAALGTDCLVP